MTSPPAAPVDHLSVVLGRLQHVLGAGRPAEDLAVSVVSRFLARGEPDWLRTRPDQLRLDVLTVHGVLSSRRA